MNNHAKFIRSLLSVIFLLGLFSVSLDAEVLQPFQTKFRFQKLNESEQLSHLVINDIVQDNVGYIWIATANGLNRYNGQDNIIYRPADGNPKSISHYLVKNLLIDNQGELWIGTQSGLNHYNSKQDNFELFSAITKNNTGIMNANIRKIFVDSKNRLWISTINKGAFIISIDRKKIQPLTIKSNLEKFSIYDFAESNNGDVYSASSKGLLKFIENESHLISVPIFESNHESIQLHIPTLLFNFNHDTFIVGGKKGLFKYSLRSKTKVSLFPQFFSNKRVVSIHEYDQDRVLLGTVKSGLYLANLSTNELTHFEKSIDDKYGLIDNQIFSISRSHDGLFWLSTNLGVNTFTPEHEFFGHIKTKSNLSECLSGNTIYAIHRDATNTLWVASFGQALHKINLQDGKCEKISKIKLDPTEFNLKNVVSIHEDRQGDIWFATLDQSVVKYSKKRDEFEFIVANDSKHLKKELMYVNSIAEDQNGNLWFSAFYSGLFRYQPTSKSLMKLDPAQYGMSKYYPKSIKSIAIDADNNLWLATFSKGLWQYDITANRFTEINNSDTIYPAIPKSLYSVNIDKENNVWIGSKGKGAYKFSPISGEIKKYSIENGLLSNDVLNIQQDTQGDMWFYTDKGLSRLSLPEETIRTFLEKDGMQADAFTNAGFFDVKTQTLWTGGINGFNHFRPKDITENDFFNEVTITDFELNYMKISPSTTNKNTVLRKIINHTKLINLNYNQNIFAFDFTAMEYRAPGKIKYKYKLDGYDSDWNLTNSDRRYANYTNIDPGNYTFRVKASNSDGIWKGKETSIEINISPPWWKTIFAYFSYFVIFLLSLYLFIRFRTRALLDRAKQLKHSIEERTYELATEKTKVEGLLSLKNEEFANVSHEFRTPLTLILGPIADVLKTNKNAQESNRLNIAQRNGYRLLRMVDQLLNLETFKVKSISQKSPQATGKIIRLIAEAFADLAKEENIKLNIGHIEELNFEFTLDALEKIVVNLLSNSIKYTKAHGQIDISTYRTSNNELQIIVADTGIGIPANNLGTIFDRYNRVLDENSEQVTGAGIGLSLVKSLVEFHQGRIEIESELGVGTKITVYLPVVGEVENASLSQHESNEVLAMELMSLTQQKTTINETKDPHIEHSDSSKPLILVIEDNEDMRHYIVDSISSDYQTITANDGEQGVLLAIEQVPDLIISDVMMPKMDGYEATQKLRDNAITNHIPIILLTARGDRESRLKGWKEKADEYITKPFDVEELKIRLVNLLEIRNILKKRFGESAFLPNQGIIEKDSSDTDNKMNQRQIHFVKQLNKVIEALYIESNTSVADIASAIAMSERQLFRKLKSVLDMTPAEYLRRFRLEKAQKLLSEGHNANYATFEVGFSSQSYFGKCFKAQFGLSPSDFKKTLS